MKISLVKSCATCDYATYDEIKSLICVNSDSQRCAEFVSEDDNCEHWCNYQEDYCPVAIDNLEDMPTIRCFKCQNLDYERQNCALIRGEDNE